MAGSDCFAECPLLPERETVGILHRGRTGWIGKPDLKMPDEFWRGTGYDRSLKPAKLDEEQPVRVAGGEESRSTLSGYVEG